MRPVTFASIAALVLALTACGGDGPAAPSGDDATTPTSDTVTPPVDITETPDVGCVDGVGDACPDACTTYCDRVMAACVGLYADGAACHEACSALEDVTGEALACRLADLDRLEGEPSMTDLYCANAAVEGSPSCTPPAPSCEAYCHLFTQACGGDVSVADCLEACQHLPSGDLAAEGDNSVACRQREAARALASPQDAATHCGAAGFSGGGTCGTGCEAYCALALAVCDTAPLFEDADSCLTACEAYSADEPWGLSCRLDQLVRSAADAGTGCANAGPDGGERCVPPPTCEAYCEQVMSGCTGSETKYFSAETCVSYCADAGSFPAGLTGDTAGHSTACRATYAQATQGAEAEDLADLCAQAGPSGGGVCGTSCEIYCETARRNCTGADALYDTPEACMAACDSIGAEGSFGTEGEDTIQCRIAKLAVAGTSTGAARSTACLAAGLTGEGGCQDLEPTCATYCGAVMTACGDENSVHGQYPDEAACLAACATWPAGSYEDTDTDTLGCRLAAARRAVAKPATECDIAGTTGGGTCGAWCDLYCGLVDAHCPDLYPSADLCPSVCPGLLTEGWAGATDGDSIQCRITHLSLVAAGGNADLLCGEAHATTSTSCAGATSPPPPSPACVAYCGAVSAACPEVYSDEAACLDHCWLWAKMPVGVDGATEGNSSACRMTLAESDGPDACGQAGPSGGGQCGTWCDNYCHLALDNCTGDYALYDSLADCEAACALFPAHGAEGDEEGDTVQCRIHFLGLATSQPGLTEGAYCPRGSVDGGGTCVDSTEELASWSGDVQAVLKAQCGACHAGVTANDCSGGSCFATHYDATQLPSYACPGETKGGCLLTHLDTGGAHHGSDALAEPDRTTIQTWIDAGQPE